MSQRQTQARFVLDLACAAFTVCFMLERQCRRHTIQYHGYCSRQASCTTRGTLFPQDGT